MFFALKGGLAAKLTYTGVTKELCKAFGKSNVYKTHAATLTRAAYRDESEVPNIEPYPYHERETTVVNMLLDTYKCRVHKHSKIIVVDGQVAAGKTKLAKELAKEFDFLFLPQPTFDDLYINYWGYDVRALDPKLPKDVQSWDIERFLQSPHDRNTAAMQMYMLFLRQRRWLDCLAHIFCTGQGVVTVRSPWTDTVFAKAMHQSKYLSNGAFEAHTDSCDASLFYYLRPHLVIYLDVPVKTTIENIKKRGLAHEMNSQVLNEKYLKDIEINYKKDYLCKISEHSHLLIYDWSEGGDTEIVVEDIENLNFDDFEDTDEKLADWRFEDYQWKVYMKAYTYDADELLRNMDIPRTDVPELLITGNDFEAFVDVYNELPDAQYEPGYNILKGDKNVMMKNNSILAKDYVTPLMKKYYERKAREKETAK